MSLGSALEPDSPADRPHRGVVHDARGRYFVKAGWPVSRILVYGSDGTLESVWDGRGEGPGEYGTIRRLMVLRGDSLGVLDGSVLRLTVLNADGSVARTQLLPINPYPHDMAQLDDGTLIVAGGQYTAAATGYLMHVIRPDGSASPVADPEWAPVDHVGLIVDERRRDTIVEVIDPDRGLVLRSERFPWVGTGFTNDGLIVSKRKDDSGVTVLDVWLPEG